MCVLEVHNCLIYSSTIVQVSTNILWCRPDVIHLDCNHSKGFSAPGPLSEARGETRVSSNAVEGAHATLYKFIRQWLGTKVGRGKNELLVHWCYDAKLEMGVTGPYATSISVDEVS